MSLLHNLLTTITKRPGGISYLPPSSGQIKNVSKSIKCTSEVKIKVCKYGNNDVSSPFATITWVQGVATSDLQHSRFHRGMIHFSINAHK